MNEQMKVEVQGYQIIDKKVKGSETETSGRVYVPKEWIGRRVKVILLEPVIEED
jgi:putative transposon-encoded protein